MNVKKSESEPEKEAPAPKTAPEQKAEVAKTPPEQAQKVVASESDKERDEALIARLKALSEKNKERILNADRDEDDVPVTETPEPSRSNAARYGAGAAAGKKLTLIAMSYPQTTPDEHTIFGFGGHKFTLGDLRDVTNIR